MLLPQRRVRPVVLLALTLLAALAMWLVLRPQSVPVPVNIGPVAQFPPGSVTGLQLDALFFDATHLPNGASVDLTGLQFPQRTIEAIKMQWDRRERPVVGNVSPVPVLIVNDLQQGVLALYQRDPQSTCLLPWQTAEERFIDPCHSSHYTYTGEYVRGPSWRGLDQFAVTINEHGEVIVDMGKLGVGRRVW